MVTIEDIIQYVAPVIPYAKMIIIFIIPYYIIIGEFFATFALRFLNILPDPTGSQTIFIIIAVVIAVIGLILGIITDPERKEKQED